MCGIAGVFVYRAAEATTVDRDELLRIRDHMAHRGPDGCGAWYSDDGRVGLAHRRLAIIDLSENGAQPMVSADGSLAVTFNGEIYNYKELRAQLEARGCVFRSSSDTEVLLHLYRIHGPDMVRQLRGMFAFGLWDDVRGRLLLARDPYGIKPLYYADRGGTLRFASSVKALLAGGRVSREPDPAGIVGFYVFGAVPEPFTIWRSIQSVPAGSTIIAETRGRQEAQSYFSVPQAHRDAETQAGPVDVSQALALSRDALLDSVRHHLMSDVPVGAFLSAGIDSGSLVGLMRDAGQGDINTLTLAYDEYAGSPNDEAPLAREVASYFDTHHVTHRIGVADFSRDFRAIMTAMDQPSIDGVNTWFVSKMAREAGLKVVISGVGGDELLGGYDTFRSLPRSLALIRVLSRVPGLGASWRRLISAARILRSDLHPKLDGFMTYNGDLAGAYLLRRSLFLPDELDDVVREPDFVHAGLARLAPVQHVSALLSGGPMSEFGKIASLETCLYLRNQLLRDTDWAGMAHSIEIRTPLVDHVLLGRITPLLRGQASQGKQHLAHAPRRGLPAHVTARKKTGFSIPLRGWVREAQIGGSAEAPTDIRLWSRSWAPTVMASHVNLVGATPTKNTQVCLS